MWGGSLVITICLIKCLHSAFLNHITLLQDPVVFKSQFGMWGGSLFMTTCQVKCPHSAFLNHYTFLGSCCVQVPVWYVGRIPGDDYLPSQVSPFCLLKSYYTFLGSCCVQVPVWYVGRIPGDDHLPNQVSPFCLLWLLTPGTKSSWYSLLWQFRIKLTLGKTYFHQNFAIFIFSVSHF